MDLRDGRLMGLTGITNTVIVQPAPTYRLPAPNERCSASPALRRCSRCREFTDSVRQQLSRVLDILLIVEGAVLLLALLIAFNSASINADERARDHATMFAFGLPPRSVMRMAVTESAVVGVLGTAMGLLLGWLLLGWLVTGLIPQAYPDLGIVTYIAPSTPRDCCHARRVTRVAAAPLFTLGKLRRMDIPSTLRVTE